MFDESRQREELAAFSFPAGPAAAEPPQRAVRPAPGSTTPSPPLAEKNVPILLARAGCEFQCPSQDASNYVLLFNFICRIPAFSPSPRRGLLEAQRGSEFCPGRHCNDGERCSGAFNSALTAGEGLWDRRGSVSSRKTFY